MAGTPETALPPLVGPEQLSERVKLLDVRHYLDGRSGRAAFEAGHLPGAVYVELEDVLAEPAGAGARRGRHPLPSPERFAAGMSAAGVADGDQVVAYDDAGGVIAARLVWLLRATGHQAALLTPTPELTAAGPSPVPERAGFSPRPWPAELLADIDQVAGRGPGTVLIDARDAARFAGGPDPVDPRSGHIPGARSLPCREHAGTRDPRALAEHFAAAGIEPGTEVISYCGSGVTACYNLLALEQAGFGPGRLYPGSWSEWSRDRARPLETG